MNDDTTPAPEAILSAVESRILGCLMEKQRTTPDTYPLTLNALVQACNQKTSRHPAMHLEAGEVGHTVNQLRDRELINAIFSGRAERYDHRMAPHFHLNPQEQALICTLMLRGPQTLGELRTNAGRMAQFADLSSVESFLRGLMEREEPYVIRLPRLPGKREERFAHLLCGEVEQEIPDPSAAPAHGQKDERIAALEAEVARLSTELDCLWELTGYAEQRPRPESE